MSPDTCLQKQCIIFFLREHSAGTPDCSVPFSLKTPAGSDMIFDFSAPENSCCYLDNRQHSLVVVWIGLDLEALRRISVDDGVDGSPRLGGRVVSVVHRQVDHVACRTFIHRCLELLAKKNRRQCVF